MGGGTREIHKDDQPLSSGTHKAVTSATLSDTGARFDVFVAQTGLAIENTTSGYSSKISAVTADTITTTDGISWAKGDTYKIYKTAARNSRISTDWVDVSRGWKNERKKLEDGFMKEDIDRDVVNGVHENVDTRK